MGAKISFKSMIKDMLNKDLKLVGIDLNDIIKKYNFIPASKKEIIRK